VRHRDSNNPEKPVDKQIQLLEVGWWPATCLEPKSAVTFDALKQFQLLNLHGSLTALEYYRTLEDLTNGDGIGIRGDSEKGKGKDKRERKKHDNGDVPPVCCSSFINSILYMTCRIDYSNL
jgi:hypothetical protein